MVFSSHDHGQGIIHDMLYDIGKNNRFLDPSSPLMSLTKGETNRLIEEKHDKTQGYSELL